MWQAQLDAFGIAEFHANECEQGHGEFTGRDDRPEIFTAFIGLINRFDGHAVFAVVDLRGWDEIADVVNQLRSHTGMGDPYYIAIQQLVETIALGMRELPEEVRLSLVLDDRPKQGNVALLYASLKANTNPALAFFNTRLGSVVNGSSRQHVGLQAADLLAYEVREHFINVVYGIEPRAERSQWQRLQRRTITGQHFPREVIPKLLEVMERQWREEADRLAADRAKEKAERAERGAAYAARAQGARI
jgi:hypothetical protein